MDTKIEKALKIIKNSKHLTAFTGAGISVESGIPPYRGKNGIWNKYDPKLFDYDFFKTKPKDSWELLRKVYFGVIGQAKPNPAHFALAEMEEQGIVKAIITQNIDNLHQEAGSKVVYEFHGNSKYLICNKCKKRYKVSEVDINQIIPKCEACRGLLKPDFVFFGESIPSFAYEKSVEQANLADVFLIIGTTGMVIPAAYIPQQAKRNGVTIIEINTQETQYTNTITDIFLQGKASEILGQLIIKR